jgi:replicative DNA helicase
MLFGQNENLFSVLPSTSVYSVPEVEWQVLLTLAAMASPAETIASNGWTEALFASEGAQNAFQELAQSRTPLRLKVTSGLEQELEPLADPAALSAARQTLVAFAQFRRMETMQLNLAREVRRLASSRRIEGIGPLLNAARTALHSVETLDERARVQTQVATLGELVASYWNRIAEQRHAASTGLGSLDSAFGGGLQAGRLFVLLGGPGSGKTTLVNQIAEHVAAGGRPVVYLTTEDPLSTLLAKSIARVGQVNYGAVLQGRASEQQAIDEARYVLAQRLSAQRLLYVESNGAALDELTGVAERHFAHYADEAQEGGPGVLVVDYLQRVARAQLSAGRGGARDLREAVTTLTEQLRDLARALNCTVIAIASQNRVSGYGNANALTSAKESGDVEYTADVLLSLAEEKTRVAPLRCEARTLSLVKNRLGPQTAIGLDWRADWQQFTEVAKA